VQQPGPVPAPTLVREELESPERGARTGLAEVAVLPPRGLSPEEPEGWQKKSRVYLPFLGCWQTPPPTPPSGGSRSEGDWLPQILPGACGLFPVEGAEGRQRCPWHPTPSTRATGTVDGESQEFNSDQELDMTDLVVRGVTVPGVPGVARGGEVTGGGALAAPDGQARDAAAAGAGVEAGGPSPMQLVLLKRKAQHICEASS